MSNDVSVFGAKSQLAKLLATEDIQVQHQAGIVTAHFDLKNRTLALPIWKGISNHLYDMLVVHEVGHALFTPADEFVNAATTLAKEFYAAPSINHVHSVKQFLNIIEDARIDRLQKKKYPGSKIDYSIGYAELADRDFFRIGEKDINTFTFIDRANLYFKGFNTRHKFLFTPEEAAFIDRMERTVTFKDVVDLTREIYKSEKDKGGSKMSDQEADELAQELMDQLLQEAADMLDEFEQGEAQEGQAGEPSDKEGSKGKSGKGKQSDDGTEAEEGEGEGNAEGEGEGSEDDEGEESEGKSGSKSDDKKSDENPKSKTEKRQVNRAPTMGQSGDVSDQSDTFVPTAETYEAMVQNSTSLVDKTGGRVLTIDLPTQWDHKLIVDDYPKVMKDFVQSYGQSGTPADQFARVRAAFHEWKAGEAKTIAFMVNEFEMKKAADREAKLRIAKTGVINTNKLHAYKYSEDIFRTNTILPNGKNHGFFMLMDWSGSMETDLLETVKQLLILTMFCKRVQIPFEVYTFRSPTQYDNLNGRNQFQIADSAKSSYFAFGGFKLRCVLSSRMKATQLTEMMENMYICGSHYRSSYDPLNGTPLNQAILASEKLIKDFIRANKLQVATTIIMTDGGSDGAHVTYSQDWYLNGNNSSNIRTSLIRDKATRRSYALKGLYGAEVTETLIHIVKEKTGCNMVGFFLYGGRFSNLQYVIGDKSMSDEASNFFKKNGYYPHISNGYDEYYIIRPNNNDASTRNLKWEHVSSTSKTQIRKAFDVIATKNKANKVLLKRFIDLVSKNLSVAGA